MGQGRNAQGERLEPFTFQDTGRSVQIRKVSTLIRSEIRRQIVSDPHFAEPAPPTSEVDYGNGMVQIANRAHPTYQQLLREWEQRVQEELSERLKQIVLTRGVVVDAIDGAAVQSTRADLASIGIDTTAYDDRYVYLAFVCIGSDADWTELLRAVFQRAAPQEAAIAAHIATFPGDVPGQGSVE